MSQVRLICVLFTRDLRLPDQTILNDAWDELQTIQKTTNDTCYIMPLFIFTPEQIHSTNRYRSTHAIQFMVESLLDLSNTVKKELDSEISFFYGTWTTVFEELRTVIQQVPKKTNESISIQSLYITKDYTPYARQRERTIQQWCQSNSISFHCKEDYMLTGVSQIMTTQKEKPYEKFTPYMRKAKKLDVPQPHTPPWTKNDFVSISWLSSLPWTCHVTKKWMKQLYPKSQTLLHPGGRSHALSRIQKVLLEKKQIYDNYNQFRDCLTYQTTQLSAYLKFGCLSIREVYHSIRHQLGSSNELIDQLYWRDFYFQVAYHYPHVFGGPMKEKYKTLRWISRPKEWFTRWKNGTTGIPIVDAGMRQLNKTGYMHNRARLIVSNFLVKIMGMDWRGGEQYFAQRLYDYDPSVNNGNWQWSSGTGADSQPYFRVFNPWRQMERFDPDAKYIKQWIPELRSLSSQVIRQWNSSSPSKYDIDYPAPLIEEDNYPSYKEEILERFRQQ